MNTLYNALIFPLTEGLPTFGWILLGGFLTAAVCALIGNFLILRKVALMGDAISHAVLPGLVGMFLITGSRSAGAMMLGALVAGIVTTFTVELIHRQSRVKPDAALGIVFSTLFALGIIMLSLFAGHVDLDAECVLYGEIGFLPLTATCLIAGIAVPWPIIHLSIALGVVTALIWIFYKPLLLSSFDPALAKSCGLPIVAIHYGLMLVLSGVAVLCLGTVGVILLVAMLILPGVTAGLISKNLPRMLLISVALAALYSYLGVGLALALDASIAASMAVVAVILLLCIQVVRRLFFCIQR